MKPADAEGLAPFAPLVQVWARPQGDAAAPDDGRFDEIAEETPVALALNGVSQAVMMATPADLEDFALGFALTEGWIDHPRQLLDIEIETHGAGIVVALRTTADCAFRQRARRRTMAGRTGCGLCGVDSLEQLGGASACPVPAAAQVGPTPQALARAAARLRQAQALHQRCGGLHAAAWCGPDGDLRLLREDVGRHNALDKLIGALWGGRSPPGDGFVLMSSRGSYELVHKAAAAGIGALACVSAPTAHAVRTALARGVALWGFVRDGRATRYA